MARLNDTRAIVGMPHEDVSEHSICSKKIANGYIVRSSSYNPETGGYHCEEKFYEECPTLDPPSVRQGEVTEKGLGDTVRYLSGPSKY